MTTANAPRILRLRDYQEPVLPAVHEALDRGVKRQLISLATGGGKTVIASHIVRDFGWRTLFVVHRDELAKQATSTLQLANPDKSIGLVKADSNELNRDIIVASAQTLAGSKRLEQLAASVAGAPLLHIEDEAHHSVSRTRLATIERLDADLLIGLTATPNRGDRAGLDKAFDEIVFHIGMLDLMRMGRLAPLKGIRIETAVDLDEVRVRAGEFMESDLAEVVNTEARNALMVEEWGKHAAGRKRTVVFCVDVAHATDVRDAFRAAGVTSEVILGSTPAEERASILADFHAGRVQVLTNCMVLTEGYDEPAIDCIVMARPTKSHGLYVQCVGRGARTSPEKEDCLVLDMADNTSRHSLVTFPSLLGEVDEVSQGEASVEAGVQIDLLELEERVRNIKVQRTVEVDLFGRSPVLWHRPGDSGVFYAPAGVDDAGTKWVTVVASGDGYMPVMITVPKDRYSKPASMPLFDRTVDIEIAKGIAEDAVDRNPLTSREAPWRKRKEEPSEAQLKFARSLGARFAPGATKAEVSAAIDERLFLRAAKRVGLEV